MVIGNVSIMRRYGWIIQFDADGNTYSDNQLEDWYNTMAKRECGHAKWYGWNDDRTNDNTAGVLKTLFKGSGDFRLDFGNCWINGVVKVYLNGRLISVAQAGVKSKVITHTFKPNSMLEIKDEGINSIVSLNSFVIFCNGKWHIPYFQNSTKLYVCNHFKSSFDPLISF